MSKSMLIEIAKTNIAHANAGTIVQAPDVMKIPASNYIDQERYEREKRQIFHRLPLVLAPTAELPNPGDYKAFEPMGFPVLLTRGRDGQVRGFINSCTHRGTNVVVEGCGNRSRFICPYHGWTFDQKGTLIGVSSKDDFGDIDQSEYGLTELPVLERAGIIWGILDPTSELSISDFLCGYDEMLAHFGMETWHLFAKRTIRGPNWKIAYDGYMDLYHLPVLHRETFGPDSSNQAMYWAWGPHQRVLSPSRHEQLAGVAEEDWPTETLMTGVWTIFPHISIASFWGGGRSIMLSQLFPGESVDESYTTQYYIMEKPPTPEQALEAEKQFELLKYVVEVEDYQTGLRQGRALKAGGVKNVLFGRNEGGGQRFHGWVERLLNADDQQLHGLFADPKG
ncbi:MAG: aromatic ring-hydroxylating dioxygenase subunit alpha [Pseudomonadales bacterium]|nr:aromatic ring-hydroxylating dioxygenase subunit alpha [Pseudomonadales bacterium]MCP5185910.1 aromatic ring-hydroxylating dioxygenase subunit alpha [Pseudomonadales bacterium]